MEVPHMFLAIHMEIIQWCELTGRANDDLIAKKSVISLLFTLGHLCMYAWVDGIAHVTSASLRNVCSWIYAESDTISCYHPPLRIPLCTNVGQGPHYRKAFPVQTYLTVHCRISAIGLSVNVIGSFQNIEIKWKCLKIQGWVVLFFLKIWFYWKTIFEQICHVREWKFCILYLVKYTITLT